MINLEQDYTSSGGLPSFGHGEKFFSKEFIEGVLAKASVEWKALTLKKEAVDKQIESLMETEDSDKQIEMLNMKSYELAERIQIINESIVKCESMLLQFGESADGTNSQMNG